MQKLKTVHDKLFYLMTFGRHKITSVWRWCEWTFTEEYGLFYNRKLFSVFCGKEEDNTRKKRTPIV